MTAVSRACAAAFGGLVVFADRDGLTVLDCSWDGYHRRTPSAGKLVWFLTNEARRFAEAAALLSAEAIAGQVEDGVIPAWAQGCARRKRCRPRRYPLL